MNMRAQLHYDRSKLCNDGASAYAASSPKFPDWEVVFRFYCAVHLIEAYFTGKSPPVAASKDHGERKKTMRALPELGKNPRFLAAYSALYDIAFQVRYDPEYRTTRADLDKANRDLAIVVSVLDAKVKRQIEVAVRALANNSTRTVDAE